MRWHWLTLLHVVATTLLINAVACTNPNGNQHSIKHGWRDAHQTNRLLRTQKIENYADGDYNTKDEVENKHNNEERTVSTSAVEKLTNSLKSTDELDDWLKKGESTDNVFKILTLDKAADGILANPKLQNWISYMKLFNEKNPTEKTSLIATLTAHYGGDGLAKIIEAAKQVSGTSSMAKRLQNELFQRWVGIRKSPDDVFSLLNLDKVGDQVFSQPQVVTWASYVDDFYKTSIDKEVALFSTLATRYNDEVLVQMLIAAKKVPSTETIATRVQAVQTKLWLNTDRKPEEIFNLLRLDLEGQVIFKSPLFTAWVQYTDEYRKIYYGTTYTTYTTIATLSKTYGDETLTKMILAAIDTPSTATMAKRLEAEQLRNWYIQKDSPKDVFKALNLYESKLTVFENPFYNVWTKYTTYLGAAEPNYKVSLLTNLLTVYGEGDLLKVLRASKKVPTTEKMATDLQDELFKSWLRAQRDPMKIYRLLCVDKAGPHDPNRLLYIEYVKAYALS